jgi:hypothetical protein
MKMPTKLFWCRVKHWRFLVPLLCLIGTYWGIFHYAADDASGAIIHWMGILPVALVTIDAIFTIMASQNGLPDEREQKELERSVADYSAYIALVAMLGCILFSLQDFFPTLWIPKTGDDWRAVMWLLIATGLGSRMISERMRALPPLEDDDASHAAGESI